MKIAFSKMHGAGNDFVMVDDRDGIFPGDGRRIAAIAAHRTGVGSEGVILIQKSAKADFMMRFYNPDGSEADLCGNGARCVAAFAKEIGAVRGNVMSFETRAGLVDAEIAGDGLVKVWMPDPSEEFAPDGTNVDFVTYRAPDRVSMRTYERGVEAESGACGTGAVAAAVVGVAQHGLSFPVKVKTASGYELVVDGEMQGDAFRSVTLTGPVKKVFDGEIELDSLDIAHE